MTKKIVPEKWIQTKVAVGFVIIVAITVVIFTITYFSVMSVIQVQNEEFGHEHEFTYLNQLVFEIIETEGLSRVYGITGKKEYYEQYMQHHDSVLAVMNYLNLLFPDKISQDGIREIKSLYLQKKELMDRLSQINIMRLNAESAKTILAAIPDSVNYEIKQYTYSSLQVDTSRANVVLEDTVLFLQKPEEEKRGFFKRMGDLFGSGKKKNEPPVELETVLNRKVDSTVMTELRPNENIEEIKTRIEQVEQQEQRLNVKVQKHENDIIQLDRLLTDQIKTIITNLHNITINRNERKRQELEALRSDMIDRILLLVATAVALMLFFILWISRDISKSMRLKSDIIRAKDRVDRLLKVKEQFVAQMSHEIRTPLTSIIGFSEQLSDMLQNHNDELAVSEKILLSAEHLNGLINNVLDSSMLESGNIAFYKDRVDAKLLMEEVYQLFELKAKKAALAFSYTVDPKLQFFESDTLRLKQVLINLIGNALKFTQEGSMDFAVQIKNSQLLFSVKDTGIGIPREKQKTVFKMFNQINLSLSRKYSGTGLGLFISRQIIEAMGGNIYLESKPGEGSTFYFEIPYKKCEPAFINPKQQVGYIFKDKNIMAVDDDEMICQLIDGILHDKVLRLDVLSSPESAIQAIKQSAYDLFMIDLHMPKVDGLQLLKIIREDKKLATPVLFLTADLVNSDLKEAHKQENTWVMGKPFTQKQILEKLASIFNIDILSEEPTEMENTNEEPKASGKLFCLEGIKSFTGNDTDFLNSVITTFINNTDSGLKDIREALKSESNFHLIISERAHKLLTGFRQFKINHGIEMLVELENAKDKKASIKELKTTANKLMEYWEGIRTEIMRVSAE
ncbi:Signal transduction histidine kinase [Saccharicrinis carchari]|uniref:histidine kinase n=1 Tax=Saccharicrinis carchari TaxID=1168039 RepID=A0A521CHJ8_SACCC|nr:ATP-binding protein [Saccharicrinis carchari]SMO58943.1 Signal transduction histidine kinase [Saccharicrinis carchari]